MRGEERGEEDVLVKREQSCFWSWSKAVFEKKGFIFWCFCKRELDVQLAFALSSFHFTERADESHWYLDLHFFFNAAHILYWGPIQLQRERKVVVKLDLETTLAKFTHSSPSCRGNLKIGGANKKHLLCLSNIWASFCSPGIPKVCWRKILYFNFVFTILCGSSVSVSHIFLIFVILSNK